VATAFAAVPAYRHYAPDHGPVPLGFLVGGIIVSGLTLSADLDIDSKQYRRWGMFRFFWWPYQKLIPHRSWISHNFIIGPLLRAAYLLAIFYGLLHLEIGLVNRWIVPVDGDRISREVLQNARLFIKKHELWIHMAILGLILGAFVHTLADSTSSFFRRKARRMRRLW